MQIFKVNALPSTLVADALYIVKSGTTNARIYVANHDGTGKLDITSDVSTAFPRYDLSVGATTGAMDLAVSQVYTIANTAGSGVHQLSLTNAPTGRAMCVVVKVNGNGGSIAFPSGAKVADGVDTELGTTSTIFVLLVIGTDVTVTSNLRINN